MAEPTILDQLIDIEHRLGSIRATMELLLAFRLIEDGHAPDLNVALAWAKDPARLRKFYPVPT